jgi:WD40 repeat protein
MSTCSGANCVDVSISDSAACSGHKDGSLRIWSIRDHKLIREVKGIHDDVITSVAYMPDGS